MMMSFWQNQLSAWSRIIDAKKREFVSSNPSCVMEWMIAETVVMRMSICAMLQRPMECASKCQDVPIVTCAAAIINTLSVADYLVLYGVFISFIKSTSRSCVNIFLLLLEFVLWDSSDRYFQVRRINSDPLSKK